MHNFSLALILVLAGLTLTLAACDSAAPELAVTGSDAAVKQDRLDVCHYDEDASAFVLLTVGAPALPAHLHHGDGVPGGEAPGGTFGPACEVVPLQRFTCETEPGVDDLGRNTLTVTLRVTDPAALPLTRGGSPILINATMGHQYLISGGEIVGTIRTHTQYDPSSVSRVATSVVGPNIPEGFVCGPYEFGAPAAY